MIPGSRLTRIIRGIGDLGECVWKKILAKDFSIFQKSAKKLRFAFFSLTFDFEQESFVIG
jgi:hypothetical protein